MISPYATGRHNNNNNDDDDDDDDDDEYICKAHFTQCSNVPLLHHQADVKKVFSFCENVWMDDVGLRHTDYIQI